MGTDFHGFEGTNLRTAFETFATVSIGLISNLKFQICDRRLKIRAAS